MNRPEPEIDIDVPLVRGLLRAQFPDLADLELSALSRGWDNTNFRLGNDRIARIPHRALAAPLIINEQQCLPEIAQRVDLAVSAPTHLGAPTDDYPWHWSITPFFSGTEAAGVMLKDPKRSAATLGTFFGQLHAPARDNAPPNPYRGCPLADRADAFEARLDTIGHHDAAAIRNVFDEALATDPTHDRVWLHGDLHARNIIVDDGQLAAIVDWGDVCAGDRATDLAGAFMLVPDNIETVREHAGASHADWQRARGWAINFAVVYLAHADNDPVMAAIGNRLVTTLLAE